LAWISSDIPWVGSRLPCDELDKELFAAATEISIGDGSIANFWHDRWLMGVSPREIAPSLFSIASRKNRTVKDAIRTTGGSQT
jgi:hypothetical protein